MRLAFASLPPLAERCRMTVAIPAKNEEASIEAALEAFAVQRDSRGGAFDWRLFDLVVFCNGCSDATAAVARAFARRSPFAVHVIETELPRAAAHIGTARRMVLDLVADRFLADGFARGAVATTDADSIVDPLWVARTLEEFSRVDVVAGYVTVSDAERDAMYAPLRLAYDREVVYRRLLGAIEARYDPRPHDPGPRHDSLVGASFAVAAQTYVAAGRLPPLPRYEDWAFALALERIDARVRHSFDVRVRTSARRSARVEGGFGTFMTELSQACEARVVPAVRPARAAIEEAIARASLREAWRDPSDDVKLRQACRVLELEPRDVRPSLERAVTFGSLWQEIQPRSRPARYPDEPVDDAIAEMRNALATADQAPPQSCSPFEKSMAVARLRS